MGQFRAFRFLALGASLAVLGLVPGCGGGGEDKAESLTDEKQAELANAYSTVTEYCISQIKQDSLGKGTGGELGEVAEAVDTAVDAYEAHEPEAEVQFTPGAPKQDLRKYMRSLQTALGTGDCALDQAQKIDEVLADD